MLLTIPESLHESEHCVQVAYTQNTLQAYDTRTPRSIPWESVLVAGQSTGKPEL